MFKYLLSYGEKCEAGWINDGTFRVGFGYLMSFKGKRHEN